MTIPRPAEEPIEDHIRRALQLMMAMVEAGKCEIRPTELDDGAGVAWVPVMDAAAVASDAVAAVERERDELLANEERRQQILETNRRMREAAEARLAAARAWLARVEPYPERNGDHFRELREILTADAPVPPQPEPVESSMLCGIYDAEKPMTWTSNGVYYARCSVCSATFEHYRAASAVELFRAHLTTGPFRARLTTGPVSQSIEKTR